MNGILTAAALMVTGAGLLVFVATCAATRRIGRALPVLLDFLTAAGLIRLAVDVTWGTICGVAAVVAVRKIATLGVRAGRETRMRG